MVKLIIGVNLFFFFVFANKMQAQDAARVIININKSFYQEKDLSIEITSKYFIDNSTSALNETKTEVFKESGKYLYKTKKSESFSNGKYKINIDHRSKIIIVAKVTNQAPDNSKASVKAFENEDFKKMLDTVMQNYKKVTFIDINPNTSEIVFEFKNGLYNSVKIRYDKKSYRVQNYTIKLNPTKTGSKDGKEHTYTYTMFHKYIDKALIPKKVFNEDNYIIIKSKNISPAAKYQGYTIVNNTKPNSKK